MAYLQGKILTESGIVTSNPCGLANIMVGKDGSNDITSFSLYHGTDNTGREIFPTVWTLDSDQVGFDGMWSLGSDKIDCNSGIYAEFTCAGAAEIGFYFLEKEV